MHQNLFRIVRRLSTLALLGLALPATAAAPAKPERHHQLVGQVVVLAMENFHLAGRPVDDAIAEEWMSGHLDNLDPDRLFFTASDVAALKRMVPELPDTVHQMPADVSPAFTVHARFKQRVHERVAFATKLLESDLDLEVKGAMWQRDREELGWESSPAALDALWTERITDQLIFRVLSGDEQADAREALSKRYRRLGEDVDDYDANDVMEGWLSALGTIYDPHTVWFKPATKDDFDIQMSDRLEGIGATLRTDGEYTRVISLVPGGPADLHGILQPDDRIVSVAQGDEKPVDIVGMRIDRVVRLIRGAKGTQVVLTVIPADAPDGELKAVRITRDEVVIEAASAKMDVREVNGKKVAVLDVPSFYQDVRREGRSYEVVRSTTEDVRKLLEELGPNGADVVLVDLRTNSGGALQQAIGLTGLFIDRGPVVQIKSKQGPHSTREVLDDEESGTAWDGPLVILTSAYSASASEIFAGALQDYRRGLVVGAAATHGKGTVQELIDMRQLVARFGGSPERDAGALKYTSSQFYRVTGKSTQRVGVVPDVILPSPYDGFDTREGDLEHALPYDEIEGARFKAQTVSWDIAGLQAASRDRVAASQGFQMMAELRKVREQTDGQATSLQLSKRQAERDEWKALEERAEAAGLDDDSDVVLGEAIAVAIDFVRH